MTQTQFQRYISMNECAAMIVEAPPRNFQPVVNLDLGSLLSQVHIAAKNTMGITGAQDLNKMFTNARK